MTPGRKRRVCLILFITTILALVVSLILYALRQNISLFYSPTQIAKGQARGKQRLRVGGMVVKGSLERDSKDLMVQFKLSDFKNTIFVRYHGILPDLFREGQGVIVGGRLINKQQIDADEVLAKHDENYMPPEIKASLDIL